MESFTAIVNGFKPLTVIVNLSILDVCRFLVTPVKSLLFIAIFVRPILEIPQNSKHQEPLFNKVTTLRPSDFIEKKTSVQAFSCEFCKI